MLPVEAVIGIGVGAAILVIIGVVVAIVFLCCCRSNIIKSKDCVSRFLYSFSAESLMTAERSFEWMAVATLPRAMSKSLMRLRSSPLSPRLNHLLCDVISGHGIIWHALTPHYLNIIVSWACSTAS